MTINDLKNYSEQMNAKHSPLDKLQVTLRRDAIAYIGAFLQDRYKSVSKALADPKIKPVKQANRQLEKNMLEDSIYAVNNPTKLTAI